MSCMRQRTPSRVMGGDAVGALGIGCTGDLLHWAHDERTDTVPATDRQASFIRSLLADRAPATNPAMSMEAILAESTGLPREQAVSAFLAEIATPGDASQVIDDLKGPAYVRFGTPAPGQPAVATVAPPEGIHYLRDGADIVLYKVQRAVHGSGKLYAKVLRPATESWEYAGRGPLANLSDATLLDYETAKQFGALYGVCGRCGRTLTDEGSIMLGIGPVCIKSAGWVGLVDPETLKEARRLGRESKARAKAAA